VEVIQLKQVLADEMLNPVVNRTLGEALCIHTLAQAKNNIKIRLHPMSNMRN